MTSRRHTLVTTILVVGLAALVALSGCGASGSPTPPRSASDDAVAAPDEAAQAPLPEPVSHTPDEPARPPATGTIRGSVVLVEAAGDPQRYDVHVASDHAMLSRYPDGQMPDVTRAWNPDRTVPNAFVRLGEIHGALERWPVPETPVVFENHVAEFTPWVQGARPGQLVVVRMGSHGHNVTGWGSRNDDVNTYGPAGSEVELRLARQDQFQLTCGAHSWITAWVMVCEHPFFDVTSETGAFEIRDVPVGEHRIRARHPTFGVATLDVEVEADAVTEVEFALPGE
jgi:hypothetical protein